MSDDGDTVGMVEANKARQWEPEEAHRPKQTPPPTTGSKCTPPRVLYCPALYTRAGHLRSKTDPERCLSCPQGKMVPGRCGGLNEHGKPAALKGAKLGPKTVW